MRALDLVGCVNQRVTHLFNCQCNVYDAISWRAIASLSGEGRSPFFTGV